jgi:GAF domain-containing protein
MQSINNPQRLQALRAYDILASAREKLFDELTELAAYVFSVPVARIAFVGREEVWHKASVGMPPQEVLTLTQTLCSRAVAATVPVLVYPDLAAVSTTEITRERNIRFYAGALLRTSQGKSIGTLCLAGYEPREFTEAEERMLARLAELVMLALEARRKLIFSVGHAAWEQLRYETEIELQNQMALVRYLKARSGGLVPVPNVVLEAVGKRLEEVAQVLRKA